MRECVKTGCVVYLEQYGSWIYGDAFRYDGVLVIRAVYECHVPTDPNIGGVRHFTVKSVADWWDERRTSMRQNSTLLALPDCWINHGYEGIPEPLLKESVT